MRTVPARIACLLLATGAFAADPAPPDSSLPVVYSADRMLRLVGFYKPDAMQLASFATELQERLERVSGVPLPRGLTTPVTWRAVAAEGAPPGLRGEVGRTPAGWMVRIEVINPGGVALASLLEAHLRGLLVLTASTLGYPVGDRAWEVPPGWLVAGLYETLAPEARRVVLARAYDDWREGRMPPLTDLLSLQVMPPGGRAERAWAAAMVAWLTGGESGGFTSLLEDVWTRPPSRRETWRSAIRNQPAFDTWMAARGLTRIPGGMAAIDQLDRLTDLVATLVPEARTRLPGAALASWLGQTHPLRREQARYVANRLRELAITADETFVLLVDAYAEALDAVAAGPLSDRERARLARRLDRTDKVLVHWRETVLARHAFLDRVEAAWAVESGSAAAPVVPAADRATALQAVTDDAERMLDRAGKAE